MLTQTRLSLTLFKTVKRPNRRELTIKVKNRLMTRRSLNSTYAQFLYTVPQHLI